jgi:hypothetical protein
MDDLKKRASRARTAAANAAAVELADWYSAENAKLAASGLQGAELQRAEMALFMKYGRRAKRNEAKAKRDNTIPKMLEREALESLPER